MNRKTASTINDQELDALFERLERYEAALAAVSVKAHEWAELAPPDDWGLTPGDTTLADAGRYLIALMANPAQRRGAGTGSGAATGMT